MKKVLVTGLNSYIGNSFEQWIKEQNEKHPEEEIQVTKCTLRGADWMKESWAGYDAILHVAGLAHVDVSSVSEESKQKYCKVNRDLAIDTAKKAKEDGVKQFINLSSIIVYGASAPIGKEKVITAETKPEPASFYGESKLQAEEAAYQQKQALVGMTVVEAGRCDSCPSEPTNCRKLQLADGSYICLKDFTKEDCGCNPCPPHQEQDANTQDLTGGGPTPIL